MKSAVEAGITPDMFMAYRAEWEWLVDRTEKRKGAVPLVADFLRHWANVQLDQSDDVSLYAEQLRTAWGGSVLVSQMLDASDLVSQGGEHNLRRAVEGLHQMIRTVNRTIEPANTFSLTSNAKEIEQEVARRFKLSQTSGGTAGIPFGRPTLDHFTGGKIGQFFGVIAARTNVGKSWELLRWALQAALEGKRVLIFSLEMDRIAVSLRLLAMESFINRQAQGLGSAFDPAALAQGRIDRNIGQAFGSWVADLSTRVPGEIEIIDKRRSHVTTGSVMAACDRFQPDELYVDGIQILRPSRRLSNQAADWQAVAEVSADLFDIASENGIPVIATSQINRTNVSNTTPPDLENLSRSDAIAQDADFVITMTDYAPNVLRAKIAKTRLGGGKGQIFHIAFEPQVGRVEEVDAHEAEQMRAMHAMSQAAAVASAAAAAQFGGGPAIQIPTTP